jgi:hypothetical protein
MKGIVAQFGIKCFFLISILDFEGVTHVKSKFKFWKF